MSSNNYIPRLLGAMFLVVAAASILSFVLFASTIGSGSISDSLVNISNKPVQMLISILIELITSLGIVVLAVLLFCSPAKTE